jgi:DNA-binding PadR family transcriptional regulator
VDTDKFMMPLEIKHMVLRLRILARMKTGRVYPYSLIKEFEKTGFGKVMGPTLKNDVYNTLKALEKTDYVKITTKLEKGRVKHYYTLTKKGDNTFKEVVKIMISSAKEANKQFR